MTEGMPSDWRDISLFMKRVVSRDAHKSHWLLVQAHRIGADQQVASAWQIYPDDVNIENARQPIDVLRAFVTVYGVPLKVADTKALFVDSESFPIDAGVMVDWTGAPEDFFVSFARTANSAAGILRVGVAYCIDLRKYRAALRKRHLPEPLLNEPAQAWQYGPVVTSLYHAIKQYGASPITKDIPGDTDPQQLSPDARALILAVYKAYAHFSGVQLSNMTHTPNTPWSEIWQSYGKNAVIPNNIIQQHYRTLAARPQHARAV